MYYTMTLPTVVSLPFDDCHREITRFLIQILPFHDPFLNILAEVWVRTIKNGNKWTDEDAKWMNPFYRQKFAEHDVVWMHEEETYVVVDENFFKLTSSKQMEEKNNKGNVINFRRKTSKCSLD